MVEQMHLPLFAAQLNFIAAHDAVDEVDTTHVAIVQSKNIGLFYIHVLCLSHLRTIVLGCRPAKVEAKVTILLSFHATIDTSMPLRSDYYLCW